MAKDNPNFTIITNDGCNAKCDFCTDSMTRKAVPDYLAKLAKVLYSDLPASFRQCSISGGEPTVSPDLDNILGLVTQSKHFDKVVFTSNGAKLVQKFDVISNNINHLNISRHAIGYDDNVSIFKTKDIIKDDDLRKISDEFNKKGIDVNLNHVYDSAISEKYVFEYLEYARSVGASSVSFRHDQNKDQLEETALEKIFANRTKLRSIADEACRTHSYLIKGIFVNFKSSFAEPSKKIDDLYELIYHITGKLTLDWEGNLTYEQHLIDKEKDALRKNIAASKLSNKSSLYSPSVLTPNIIPNVYGGRRGSTGGGCGGCGA